jgi:hypothetical protein
MLSWVGIRSWSGTKLHRAFFVFLSLFILFAPGRPLRADSAPFDLIGPVVEAKVSRGGKSLPISAVPNLQAGDRLWIQADFPGDQSAHYLLIVAFLQGPTNPPPENWFTPVETWNRKVREEGTLITVPKDAQQALFFLAPDAQGVFATLRSTVRGRPGVFVRASQNLEQASLDRTRLDKFLEEIRTAPASDTTPLVERVALLSRTLAVTADPKCFEKPASQQSSCLTQNTDRLTLNDMHSQSLMATLTTGPSADLVGAVSTTSVAKAGYYSPYVGSAMDLMRLFSGLRTPQLQYLPALALPKDYSLNLRLNSPPSFTNPRSVLVAGLPPVKPAELPILHPVDTKQVFCIQNTQLVLSLAGEPLVFSTDIAHDFDVRLQGKSSQAIDLPATPDAARGGFTVDIHSLKPDELTPETTGTLRGLWGFESYEGPFFPFRSARQSQWTVPPSEADSLVVGRQDTLHLQSAAAACVEKVSAVDGEGNDLKANWKILKPDELEVQLPLKDEPSGTVKLLVQQYGLALPDTVSLHTYSEAARLDGFQLSSGDRQGTLTGTRLDEVRSFELDGIQFTPGKLSTANQKDVLELTAPSNVAAAALPPSEKVTAHVALKDGRTLELQTTIEPPRPKVSLASKSITAASDRWPLHLGADDELPQNGRLSFLLKADIPDKFPHGEQIEVATADGSAHTLLSLADGGLILQEPNSVLAILDPLKNLGASAFGLLQFRPVDEESGKGDWQLLVKLVRTPLLNEVRCPDAPDQPCVLNGSGLFLLDSVASDSQFKNAVSVPIGYGDNMLNILRPNGTLLYIKLRDDPSTVDTIALPVLPQGY